MTTTDARHDRDDLQPGDRAPVTITYLEQREAPARRAPAPAGAKLALIRAEAPPVHFYRYLYRQVGDPCHWVSRRRMGDEELARIIHDPEVFIYVLYVDGAPAGLAEVDARSGPAPELKFFGLIPEFAGRGFGRYFLLNVLDLIWTRGPEKVRLETCTLDHPAALPLYQKVGFTVVGRSEGVVEIMERAAAPH